MLVRVCRQWRSVVFASPNFLRLRLQVVCDLWECVERTAIWPPLPIILRKRNKYTDWTMLKDRDFNAAIVHHDRVCEIDFSVSSLELQRLAPALQKPFPALIHLSLASGYPTPVLPDGFLGGSAPCLQSLEMKNISFPALPSFILSATDLVSLTLLEILDSGHISPEVLVTHLAMLSHLESLHINFKSPPSRPDRASRRPEPPTRSVFLALTRI